MSSLTLVPQEIMVQAATRIATALVASGLLEPGDLAESVNDIATHCLYYYDGYECAKALERYAYWSCDFQMCEVLDGLSDEVRRIIAAVPA